ncbi:DUF5344 family protein [Bacillus carboniphilus]|uniref:DUF5344 family protein n=1 Tax=Bacillus carboniphilus TaxID=86663 RepID=A0ABY9JRN1_9BACI|nr:DUF5344 family protein [Bacillus carboniphilus]WLR41393.1 DUF5344 family protein [Bacillus carboniphilus]
MSKEMKVRYGEVEQAISSIDKTLQSVDSALIKDMASGTQLDLVKKLNEINHLLEETSSNFKDILTEHNQLVNKSLQDLKEADDQISSSLKMR